VAIRLWDVVGTRRKKVIQSRGVEEVERNDRDAENKENARGKMIQSDRNRKDETKENNEG
jgi:hypothetical protein